MLKVVERLFLPTGQRQMLKKNAGRKAAIASKAEHVIHNKDGKISNSNSYGNDPYPPKDKK